MVEIGSKVVEEVKTELEIKISPEALEHFGYLLEQEDDDMNIRIFLDSPGQQDAEVGISFCPAGEQKAADLAIDYDKFILFVDKPSIPFLAEASINYRTDDTGGGHLSISAPNIKGKKPSATAPLEDRVKYVIDTEINPNLAGHGGMVSLVEITDDMVVILKFGGGCHGCGMVNVTLQQGIETNLKNYFPEIVGVKDATDHTTGENPYYA